MVLSSRTTTNTKVTDSKTGTKVLSALHFAKERTQSYQYTDCPIVFICSNGITLLIHNKNNIQYHIYNLL